MKQLKMKSQQRLEIFWMDKKIIPYQNLLDSTKQLLEKKFTVVNIYIKEGKLQIKNHLKELQNAEWINPNKGRRKKRVISRAEIIEIENNNQENQ